MSLGDATTSAEALDRVQSAVGEPSTTGINALLGKFYTAWSDLANHPESDSSKQAVTAAAQTLGDAFGKLANDINGAINDANTEFNNLTGAAGPIKSAATSLAQLNKAIDSAIDAGQSPNDLLDRRDQILDDLSQYGQVSVTNLGNGRIQVMLGNQSVVNDQTADWQTPPPVGFNAGGGQLGALKTLATTTLPGYLASLDAVAKTLHDDVNAAYGSTFFSGDTAATLGSGIPTTSLLPSRPCATRAARRASTARSCARSAPTPRTPRTPRRSPSPRSTPPRTAARTSRASRSTRRWPTCCASSAATRPRPGRCRRSTTCSTR
jgi:flagellar hook-associated protein 1